MIVAVTRLLGSKGLKPLVTATDFATLTQSIRVAALLGQGFEGHLHFAGHRDEIGIGGSVGAGARVSGG